MNLLQNRIKLSYNDFKKIFIYLLGFYILFQPDLSVILPIFKTSIILFFLGCFFLWYFRNEFYHIMHNNKIVIYIIIMCIINLYTLIPTFVNKINLINNFNAITFSLNMICILSLFFLVNKNFNTLNNKFDYFIKIGVVQGVICILMLFIPSIKDLANYLYISNIPNYETSAVYGIVLHRIYGFANDYTFSMSISMALLSSLAFLGYMAFKNKKYLIYSLVIMIGSILNGRTGLLIFLLASISIIFLNLPRKEFFKYLCIIAIIGFSLLFIIYLVDFKIIYWLLTAFVEVFYLVTGTGNANTFNTLSSFIFFPNGLPFLFGMGSKVFGIYGKEIIGMSSDIGYINEIWRGGFFYISVFYVCLYKIFKNVFIHTKNIFNQKIALSLIILFSMFLFISNFKGEALSGSSILMIFIFYSLLFSNELRGIANEEN